MGLVMSTTPVGSELTIDSGPFVPGSPSTDRRRSIGLETAGVRMTPEEFDAIGEGDYDEIYRYELIDGVLVVHAIPLPDETGPNEQLGYLLLRYQETHPQGQTLNATLPQQYVRTRNGRRIADRLLWIGLGRRPNLRRDVATLAVEFVSAGRRNWRRDYEQKRDEYREAGLKEYWIIDRFRRSLTVYRYLPSGIQELAVAETETYQPELLPGFELPLAQILAAADSWAQEEEQG
jgi:Uma2 family endonuclease